MHHDSIKKRELYSCVKDFIISQGLKINHIVDIEICVSLYMRFLFAQKKYFEFFIWYLLNLVCERLVECMSRIVTKEIN